MGRISYSQLSMFSECPERWKLNYVDKLRVFETNINNFENIYIPGFGRTYDSGKFGMGFGYSISYLVPMYRKAK